MPILGGRRLARLVCGGGGACPSGGCQVGRAIQLVGPVPTSHGAVSGRQAPAGCGPATGASPPAQPSGGHMKAWWPPRNTTSLVMRCSCRELKPLSVASALDVSVHASLPCVREYNYTAYLETCANGYKVTTNF